MDTSVIKHQLNSKVTDVSDDFSIKELDELLKTHGLDIDYKPITLKVEHSNSTEEPSNLNSRLINLGKTQTVTLLATKVIYNAYKESDLTTLIRVGIIPNYEELLPKTVELLELFSLFVLRLKHSADVTYINTPGMTVKEYRNLSAIGETNERCETILKSLKLNTNYALYTLHYNLLSGSTIIQEINRYENDAQLAIDTLSEYLNTASKDVDEKVLLTKYHTLKETYQRIIVSSKKDTINKLNKIFNQSSQINLMLSKMEEEYTKRLEHLNQVDYVVNKLDESQQSAIATKLSQLYENQLILYHSKTNSGIEDIADIAVKTLALYEKNFNYLSENLEKIKVNLSKRTVSDTTQDAHKSFEEIIKCLRELFKTQKNYDELKHIVEELVEGKDEEEE